jgi:hypothetical protein
MKNSVLEISVCMFHLCKLFGSMKLSYPLRISVEGTANTRLEILKE